jgi:glutamate/tyrosine decarboxylase-like PLP-dependent enzyme
MTLPTTGIGADAILEDLDARRSRDPDVHGARLFGLVYPTGRLPLDEFLADVNRRFLFHNALNPFRFPEIAGLEAEVVAMTGSLVGLPEVGGGSMTSGGTESILMSMLVNRERARARGIERPQILAPVSAHPAYAKAAHYFDMDVVRVPLTADHFADVDAAASLIGPATAVVVASAFSYPYGVMDPVTELAALARDQGAGCHVDACIGGFVLPFLERLGVEVPPWDFRVDGVTEISTDIHKYGYAPKGASVILHRDPDWFAHQVFLYDQWPSGMYGSPGVAGARSAAPIATAWAVLRHLGWDGYVEIMREVMATAAQLRVALDELPGLAVVGDPIGPVLAFTSTDPHVVDIGGVGDAMDDRGWHLNRLVDPPGLHLMLSPAHAQVIDALVADLGECLAHHERARSTDVRYS